jgi:hypothetical protein
MFYFVFSCLVLVPKKGKDGTSRFNGGDLFRRTHLILKQSLHRSRPDILQLNKRNGLTLSQRPAMNRSRSFTVMIC